MHSLFRVKMSLFWWLKKKGLFVKLSILIQTLFLSSGVSQLSHWVHLGHDCVVLHLPVPGHLPPLRPGQPGQGPQDPDQGADHHGLRWAQGGCRLLIGCCPLKGELSASYWLLFTQRWVVGFLLAVVLTKVSCRLLIGCCPLKGV